ncbi:hypothetical protein F5X99DRAFT_135731 [Biscogniauxia marginata]|nr:hypothetical protein F5X99DRAFT_135731 [Biscogniauxia marginata]
MATKPPAQWQEAPLIEVVDRAEDIVEGFNCVSEAFGRQARDAIWVGMNPGWDTPEGKARGAAAMVEQWRATTRDNKGNANSVYLKATLPDPRQDGRRIVVGLAIWAQASFVPGRGEAPSNDLHRTVDLEALYPGDEAEQRFLCQVWRSLVRRRIEVVREKATAEPPSVMVLEMCATDPSFQRRGIASRLVQWGLDEARRRGIPEATTEASSMGRSVYERLGFRPEGPDIVYDVDAEFLSWDKPPNIFMRISSGP